MRILISFRALSFTAIFEQSGVLVNRCFISNDLTSADGYKNSNFKRYHKDKLPYHTSGTKWPLPYRCCITAPICPGISTADVNDGTLIGFLCIDFASTNLFNDSDVEIAAGLAEGLYDALSYYIRKYVLKT